MNESPPIGILLVEDDELFRLGLSTRLRQEPGLKIVAEAVDGETALELTNRCFPNVVLLDIGLPGIGGVEACRQIRQKHPELPILVLTSHYQKSSIERLIAAGASGYCLKGIEAEVLILALRSVAAGASWWDKLVTAEIRAAMSANSGFSLPEPIGDRLSTPLTKREREILEFMTLGKANQEIAEHLNIAIGTVRVHVHAILQKLEVRDRTQAALLALQKGLVKNPEGK